MAVPTLRNICQLRLAEDLSKNVYDCVYLVTSQNFILDQLDQGAWGSESLAILKRAVKYYNLIPRVLLALLPSNTRDLMLKHCPLLTENCLNKAIQRCSLLETLDLTEDVHLDFSSINLFGTVRLETRILLTTVILEDCPQVNDTHVQTLLLNAPNLHHLNIARCSITDGVFLLNEAKQLTREACLQIESLISDFDCKLQTVDVSRCEEFSSTGVRYLYSLCGPFLRSVNLAWTNVDCQAFLYLSGMGYALSQSDANFEDIVAKWTSSDKSKEQIHENIERTEGDEEKTLGKEEYVKLPNSIPHPIDLHDIQPVFNSVPADGNDDCLEDFTKEIVSLLVCDDNENSFDNSVGYEEQSYFNSSSKHSGAQNAQSYEVPHSPPGCVESACCAESESSSDCCDGPTLVRNGHGSEVYDATVLFSTSADKQEKYSSGAITDDNCHNLNVERDMVANTQCNNPTMERDMVANTQCDNPTMERDMVANTGCDNLMVERDMVANTGCDNLTVERDMVANTQCDNLTVDRDMVANTGCDNPTIEHDMVANTGCDNPTMEHDMVANTGCDNPTVERDMVANTQCDNLTVERDMVANTGCDIPTIEHDIVTTTINKSKYFVKDICCSPNVECDITIEDACDHPDRESPEYSGPATHKETDVNYVFDKGVKSAQCGHISPSTCANIEPDRNFRSNDKAENELHERKMKNKYSSPMKIDLEPNITDLYINGNVFKEENLGLVCLQAFLKANKNVTSLTLFGEMNGSFVTDMIIDLIGHYCPRLIHLSIEGCDQVTNIGATAIVKNCKDLTTLDLTGVPFLGDSGVVPLLRSLPLKELKLAETQITSLSLDAISNMSTVAELRELDLSWCEEIDEDMHLNGLVKVCPSLTRLMLRETPLTPTTLSLVAEHCHNITELSIASNMSNVLDDSVCLLAENLPLLEKIDLGWNSHLTDKAIHSLFKNCHYLWNANLEGLKQITSFAFSAIIIVPDELKDFLAKDKEAINHETSEETTIRTEVLPCLPHRSTTYCTELRHVNLKYSDFVEDSRLQELVTVTQGSIKVIDYYGEEVEQLMSALINLLKRYSTPQTTDGS